jgi:hypothetical protein
MAPAAHATQAQPEPPIQLSQQLSQRLCLCPIHARQSAARRLAYRRLALAIALSHTPLLWRSSRIRRTS